MMGRYNYVCIGSSGCYYLESYNLKPLLVEKNIVKTTDTIELEKSKAHIIVEIIEYMPNAVVSKTIIKRISGNITASSFDAGEELDEKTSPFDTYVQIIDGTAEIIINKKNLDCDWARALLYPRTPSINIMPTSNSK